MSEKAGLYLVALPIGNLGDMSFRAIETLRNADEIWAEDTRKLRKILTYFDISKPASALVSCHDHNERSRSKLMVQTIQAGQSIAYVSDAGMPLVSDPGYWLVQAAVEAGISYTVIPGASSVLSALALSAMPADRFAFLGFIPTKQKKRSQFYAQLMGLNMTVLLFESPRRLHASLEAARNILGGDVLVAIIREITKIHEEVIRGSLEDVLENIEGREIRGEIVVVFAPLQPSPPEIEDVEMAIKTALTQMRLKDAVKAVSQEYDLPRNQIYALALEIAKQD